MLSSSVGQDCPCAQDGDADLLSGTLNKITLTKTPQTQMKFHFPFLLYAWLGCGSWSSPGAPLAVQAGAVGFLRARGQAPVGGCVAIACFTPAWTNADAGSGEEMDTSGQMQCLLVTKGLPRVFGSTQGIGHVTFQPN